MPCANTNLIVLRPTNPMLSSFSRKLTKVGTSRAYSATARANSELQSLSFTGRLGSKKIVGRFGPKYHADSNHPKRSDPERGTTTATHRIAGAVVHKPSVSSES